MSSDNNDILTIQSDALRQVVSDIKRAIVVSQSRALRMVNGQQLSLYFGIGCYVSEHSRHATWGTGAIDAISQQLQSEMPGLRGFSAESIKKMRMFAEYWSQYINRSPLASDLNTEANGSLMTSEIEVDTFALAKWSSVTTEIHRDEFLAISFTHVATYRTRDDMPEPLRKSLPDLDEMAKLL